LYKSAASAATAGFRPCLRCRPESSPGTPAWSGSSWKVSRALQLIDQGFLDTASVDELAQQLEVGPRQLSRLFQQHLGASPVEVAQTRRLHFAKKLIDETAMPLAEICFAAGFGSVRRFNAVFNKTYGRSPKELREKSNLHLRVQRNIAANRDAAGINGIDSGIELSLSYRPPYDWQSLLAFLAYRAIPGVEAVTASSYARTISLDGVSGHFIAHFEPTSNRLKVQLHYPESRHLYHIIDRIRSIFDLRADSTRIDQHLGTDRLLQPMLENFPGLRVPGCWDGFEVAVRAILGQQISVKAASTLVARIVEKFGEKYIGGGEELLDGGEHLRYIFPSPAILADADLSGLGIVTQRMAAIKSIAVLIHSGELQIDCSTDTDKFTSKICEVKGIGEWTAHYIAMRALNDPDAFPHSDLILRRAAAPAGETLTARQLLADSESWQPWRAYAVILLWRNYQSEVPKTRC
jgi:AraC family transcriptional regulator of adaptative response / DNA-3-methyladenine glycosylase II